MEQIDGGVAPVVIGLGIAVVTGAGLGYSEAGLGGAFVGGVMAIPTTLMATVAMSSAGIGAVFYGALSVGSSFLGDYAIEELRLRQRGAS